MSLNPCIYKRQEDTKVVSFGMFAFVKVHQAWLHLLRCLCSTSDLRIHYLYISQREQKKEIGTFHNYLYLYDLQ